MAKDEFTKLFKYMESFRKDVDKRFEQVDKRFDDVQTQINGLAKLITEYHQEMIFLTRKVDRMERWIQQIAKKTGVKLSY